jgi:protein-S-isoprenylcysteine O-methyltransferase Ste14
MWKVAALAWMPINAVLFGLLVALVAVTPGLTDRFATGAWAIYGAAALSIVVAVPLSWWVARRMLARWERRRLNDPRHGAGAAAADPRFWIAR